MHAAPSRAAPLVAGTISCETRRAVGPGAGPGAPSRGEAMKHVVRALCAMSCVAAWACAGHAFAASAAVSGSFSGAPTLPVVFITTPTCLSQGSTPVRYRAYALSVGTSGSYSFAISGDTGSTSLYVYTPTFDPLNPLTNCIAASNLHPVNLPVTLTAGASYVVVPFDDTSAQSTTTFTLTVSGTGPINLGAPPAPTSIPVPTLGGYALAALALLLALAAVVGVRARRA